MRDSGRQFSTCIWMDFSWISTNTSCLKEQLRLKLITHQRFYQLGHAVAWGLCAEDTVMMQPHAICSWWRSSFSWQPFADFVQFCTHFFRCDFFIHSLGPSPKPLKDRLSQQRVHNIMTFACALKFNCLASHLQEWSIKTVALDTWTN